MSILPNSRLTLFVTREKLTVFNKIGKKGVAIDFSQPKNQLLDALKKAIPVDAKNKKVLEIEILFGLNMSFIYSTKKSPKELILQADQMLPYASDEADFFVVQGDTFSTVFASPNPIKNLIEQAFEGKVKIIKYYPLLLLFSPKIITKIPSKSKTILTCLASGTSTVTILTASDFVLDYQTYKRVEPHQLVSNLIEVYKSDPDFGLIIDTVITDLEITDLKREGLNIIKTPPFSTLLDEILITNYHKLKHRDVISLDDIKKSDVDSDQSLPQQEGLDDQITPHNKKISAKLLIFSSIILLLLLSLGVIIFMQFQSTKPGNVRKNGTVAPSVKSGPTTAPTQKFSQPKTTPAN